MDPNLFVIDPELLDAADTECDAELSPTGEESEKNEAEDEEPAEIIDVVPVEEAPVEPVPEPPAETEPEPADANAEANADAELKLPPLQKKHERKTFATHTLKIIHSRIQYYKKVINQPPPEDPKQLKRYENLKKKYESNIRKRNLLKKAVKNLYL